MDLSQLREDRSPLDRFADAARCRYRFGGSATLRGLGRRCRVPLSARLGRAQASRAHGIEVPRWEALAMRRSDDVHDDFALMISEATVSGSSRAVHALSASATRDVASGGCSLRYSSAGRRSSSLSSGSCVDAVGTAPSAGRTKSDQLNAVKGGDARCLPRTRHEARPDGAPSRRVRHRRAGCGRSRRPHVAR